MSIFTNVKKAKVPKTAFNLSHERKQTQELGKLCPILLKEVVPGDRFKIRTESLIRLAPMTSPVMHRMNAYIHYFYVPTSIIWKDFEKFITGDLDIESPMHSHTTAEFTKGLLGDYLGLPQITSGNMSVSELPYRAYWKIWNEYYRDENLQTEKDVEKLSGSDWLFPATRSMEKDYFTSSLPWPQKGGEVNLPITIDPNYKVASKWLSSEGSEGQLETSDADGNFLKVENYSPLAGSFPGILDNLDPMESSIDINDLRTATRLQRWLERNARAGSRYVEHLLAHWGVKSSDGRLNRPEYIGGGKTPITVSEVLQTSESGNTPQGEMTGHGIAVGATNSASYFCEEHGYIMGILSIIPRTGYSQGMEKLWQRKSNLDYYSPEFAHLGEQEVKNYEVYLPPNNPNTDPDTEGTFGYQSRFAEYKYAASSVHGDFKPGGGLEQWHMNRKFANLPTLNEQFIANQDEYGQLSDRIFAVSAQDREHDPFWIQLFHNITAVRPMPYHNNPSL